MFIPANTFNETEFLGCRNALQAAGKSVFFVSSSDALCRGNGSLILKPDVLLANCRAVNFSSLLLIGGSGVPEHLHSVYLKSLIRSFAQQRKTIGAICLAPMLLGSAGIISGKKISAHPDAEGELISAGAQFMRMNVCQDGNFITAAGAEHTLEWVRIIIQHIEKNSNGICNR